MGAGKGKTRRIKATARYNQTPKGAPILCKLGRHVGQEQGGLMAFTCTRCGGIFRQTDPEYIAAMDKVRILEAEGKDGEVSEVARAGNAEEMFGVVNKTGVGNRKKR